jgi:hypothetical protein
MKQAAAVSHTDNARDASLRVARWGEQWREQEPHSVTTRERDVEHTLVFSSLRSLAPR